MKLIDKEVGLYGFRAWRVGCFAVSKYPGTQATQWMLSLVYCNRYGWQEKTICTWIRLVRQD
jgi:hypothetical protein